MGLLSSLFSVKKTPVVLVTLDALGTVYGFRKPLFAQYRDVARRVKPTAEIDPKELEHAFRQSYKHHCATFPNYGKGKLESPEVWWSKVVHQTFGQFMDEGSLGVLAPALYTHFSTKDAYEPFSDVKPFLQNMAALKRRFTDPDGPIILTGIVTNSDPRVGDVLRDMGFRLGSFAPPSYNEQITLMMETARRDPSNPTYPTVTRDFYKIEDDFDVVCTSYAADAEKPAPEIWDFALEIASTKIWSRGEQTADVATNFGDAARNIISAGQYRFDAENLICIHIGDELEKDYIGASNSEPWSALLLSRGEEEQTSLDNDIKKVKSLHEAFMVINLMVQDWSAPNSD